MSTADPDLRALLAVAQEAAWVGGRRTLSYFGTGTAATELKADQTPVTRADREAEGLIRGVIARAFPEHAVLGEEDGETAGSGRFRALDRRPDRRHAHVRPRRAALRHADRGRGAR